MRVTPAMRAMDSAPSEGQLDPTALEDYLRDGAVRIRGLFTKEQIADLTQGIEENLRDPSPLAQVASDPDDPGWSARLAESPPVRRLL